MGTLRFNDGMSFNTDGPLRIVSESDGLYVAGEGMLCPVNSREEGERLIAELKSDKRNADPR